MRGSLNLFIFLIFQFNLAIAKDASIHFPVMGDKATTVKNFKLNFDKMPGGQVTDSVGMNAISLGLGPRVEIGFIPWVYLGHNDDSFLRYGYTFKYNFYKSRRFQWALGTTQIKGELSESSSFEDSYFHMNFEQNWNYYFLAMNYTPDSSLYNCGITLKHTKVHSFATVKGKSSYQLLDETITQSHFTVDRQAAYNTSLTLDMNYHLKRSHWLGMALGTASLNSRLNINDKYDEENNSSSKTRYVVGSSYIYQDISVFLITQEFQSLYLKALGLNLGFQLLLNK